LIVASRAYLALAIGSMPLFLMASADRGDAKNAINLLALSDEASAQLHQAV
jgi:hypothetical protein